MRLTLRTLLAYLDDILKPAETKEIGTKLVESKFASDLVDRIKEVMRRRRLAAPDLRGQDGNIDVNIMAEYLDNVLTPEKVTEVEKRCLESDIHLAEAAACHQILTLVLGEPVDIAPESRRRMYGLVSQASGDDKAAVAAARPPAVAAGDDTDDLAMAPQIKDQTETIGSAIPDYLKPSPLWRRGLFWGLASVVVLIFAATIYTDEGWKWWGKEKATTVTSAPVDKAPAADVKPEGAADESAKPPAVTKGNPTAPAIAATGDGAKTSTTTPAGPATSASTPSATQTATPTIAHSSTVDEKPAPKLSTPATGAQIVTVAPRPSAVTTPADRSLESPKTPPPISKINAATAAAPAAIVPATPPEVRLASNTGILLGFDPDRNDWFAVERPTLALPTPADVAPEADGRTATAPKASRSERRADDLVAPEPFDHVLEFGDHLCRVWMLSGTSVRLLAPNGTAAFGIELRQGRIVIRSGSQNADGSPYRPLSITIVVRDEEWRLDLLKPDTQCGLEVMPLFPSKRDENAKEVGYRGGLYVVSGDVRFAEPVGRQRTLVAGRWISLAPSDRSVATDKAGSAFRTKGGPASLSWLNPEARRTPGALTKVAHDFEHEFIPGQAVSLSIGTVAKDDRPKISELAVKTLAMTGQYQTLVEVLAQVPHEEAVAAAIQGLRAWLPLAPQHGALLEKELGTVFVPQDQQVVLRLLWGYNSDDARDMATSKQLVEWLDNDRLAIRLLAIAQINDLTGQSRKYRAGAPPSQRKAAKKEWENFVTRNKGLLKP